jgi:hypothetical protein
MNDEERWRGWIIIPRQHSSQSKEWEVEFSPTTLQHERGMGGKPRFLKSAKVTVHRDGTEFRVIRFEPPEKTISNLTNEDYQRKAVEITKRMVECTSQS